MKWEFSLFLDNLPPTLSGPTIINATVGQNITFRIRADDPEGDEVIISLADDAQVSGYILEDGVFTWLPTAGLQNVDIR